MLIDFQQNSLEKIMLDLRARDDNDAYIKAVQTFLEQWNSDEDRFSVKTSGTTGPLKEIAFPRASLISSARITLDNFSLKEGDTVISALPLNFVAGRMMIVRAIVGKLKVLLLHPSSNPIRDLDQPVDFAAFTPYQLQHIIQESPDKLSLIKKAIIGGSKVDDALEKAMANMSTLFFETFGMSETLTHLAIRALNGPHKADHFTILKPFQFAINNDRCLLVKAAHISDDWLTTTDIIEKIDDAHFLWLGRKDHVINSGGVKVYPETIEKKIGDTIPFPFIITKRKDAKLGEKVVLIVQADEQDFVKPDFKSLSRYEIPKEIRFVSQLARNENGKIIRNYSYD
jgi:O-succinylbenzoic acid--CoA ligase